MNNKNCKSCKHWEQGHEGFWTPDRMGFCNKLNNENFDESFSFVSAICEGCVHVRARVDDFELCTGDTFYCNNWESKTELNKPYKKIEIARLECVTRPTIDKWIKEGRLELINKKVVRTK